MGKASRRKAERKDPVRITLNRPHSREAVTQTYVNATLMNWHELSDEGKRTLLGNDTDRHLHRELRRRGERDDLERFGIK